MPVPDHTVILEGTSHRFKLVRRDRQKHIYIRITAAGRIVVSAPERIRLEEIKRTLTSRSSWILSHIRSMRAHLEKQNPLRTVWYCGKRYRVQIREGIGRRIVPDSVTETLYLTLSECDAGSTLSALESWLRAQAKTVLNRKARAVSEETGIGFGKLFLRNQRTRWGSSSSIGNISLNWRIIMAPPEVQRYLIVHELVHQLHQNHSKEYWQTVAEFCPDYRKHAQWLKKHAILNSLFR